MLSFYLKSIIYMLFSILFLWKLAGNICESSERFPVSEVKISGKLKHNQLKLGQSKDHLCFILDS